MKHIKNIFRYLVIFLISTECLAQKSNPIPLEIYLATEEAEGKSMVFTTESNTSPIWYPTTPHVIDTENWDNPIDLIITGNYSKDGKGWELNNSGGSVGNPFLGKAELYTVKVYVEEDSSKDASFTIESYGGVFNGDVYITYNYADDEFYYRGTKNIVSHLDMYDNPAWLQPTPPQDFHCTNPTAYGQHPHFAWSAPEEPDGVTFYYHIYRDLGAGFTKITTNPITATEYTDIGIEINKFGGNTAHYYVTA